MSYLLLLTLIAETYPLGISLRPPNIELPLPTERIQCDPGMSSFHPDPVPLLQDQTIEYVDKDGSAKKWTLRLGILVSECGFVEILNTKAEHSRMVSELEVRKNLMKMREAFWAQAEIQYQKRILKLEDERSAALHRTFWEEWKGPILFGLGIITAAVIAGVSVEILKAGASWNASLVR